MNLNDFKNKNVVSGGNQSLCWNDEYYIFLNKQAIACIAFCTIQGSSYLALQCPFFNFLAQELCQQVMTIPPFFTLWILSVNAIYLNNSVSLHDEPIDLVIVPDLSFMLLHCSCSLASNKMLSNLCSLTTVCSLFSLYLHDWHKFM